MATDIKVPTLGESISEGTIARWLKKDGDVVRAEEPVLELETEKATAEIAAPASGALRIAVPEGKTVPIGAVVGSIEEVSAARSSAAPGPTPAERQDRTAPSSTPLSEPAKILSPAARRLASERGLDIASLKGTGPGGRVTKEDVLDHLERGSAPAAASVGVPAAPSKPDGAAVPATIPVPRSSEKTAARETRQRMSAIRQRIADRLVSAQRTAAILTTFNEADLSAVIALRERFKDAFKEKHGVGLGFMSFFVKATIEALRAFPTVNAWIDGSDIVYHDYYNIGVAVSTEKGLMVPVLRDADKLSFADIEARIAELARKARDGKITVDDLQGGTFTITNGGIFGSLLSTPIVNPPQSAILGMHAIQKRPVALNDQVVIRPMMYLAVSYDHRLVDGREAVQFLVRIKECVEKPERLLLEI
ncbi:MAG TPA: 2-oxoglutarate dehydrogenase complex dihydrolipoyllysine-residue succinyltransferase [Gemmataceae bacterium]|nr:2-oxoglutarate dehydrogenase complex dihydrolipoyllysine-residue succinyltransferase [Gemmataceae bacterium]